MTTTAGLRRAVEPTQAAIDLAEHIHAWWSNDDDSALTPAQRAQQFIDDHCSAVPQPIPADLAAMVASPVEEAYGILWRQTTDNKQIHQARKLLLSTLDVAGQRRGINAALEQFGPVDPYETVGLADWADVPVATRAVPNATAEAAQPVPAVNVKRMVDRFLRWKLPRDFAPDAGISFKADYNENTDYPAKHEPTGTNLFDAVQADAMVRFMLTADGKEGK